MLTNTMLPLLQYEKVEKFIMEHRNKPFFTVLSLPSCHAPFTPEPRYINASIKMAAPRGGSFNIHFQVRLSSNSIWSDISVG